MITGERHQIGWGDFPPAAGGSVTFKSAGLEPLTDLGFADAQPFGGIWRGDAFNMANENRVGRLVVTRLDTLHWVRRRRCILLLLPAEFIDFRAKLGALAGTAKKTL